jgi:biopolymer transport protein TolR
MARFNRRSMRRNAPPEIVLTPLIDTFCVLLVIFMVAAPMVTNGIRVNLPQGKSKEGGGAQELVVTIGKDKTVYFNSYPIKRQDLASSVQKALAQNSPDTPVFVRADEHVSYGEVISVVDELKQAGIAFVAMSTRPA